MLLVFENFFCSCNITDRIYTRRRGVGREMGQVGSQRWGKATIQMQTAAVYESRHGHFWSSIWHLWIVHKCNFYTQAKNGLQFLSTDPRFSKIQSHICTD